MPISRRLVFLLKILLVAGFLWLLVHELWTGNKWSVVWTAFQAQRTQASVGWMVATLLLLPLNWLVETQKWRLLLRAFEPASWGRAWRGVLAGVSLAVFTPNRLGEFGGRVLFIAPRHRWRAVVANVVSIFSQTMVVLTAGALGLLWFMLYLLKPDPFYTWALILLTTVGLTALFFFFFNIRLLIPLLRRLPLLRRIRPLLRGVSVLAYFSRYDLFQVLLWAALRYLIYSAQYFFLLQFFGIQTGFWGGLAGIFTLFLLQTGIPLPPAMGLVARGSLAVQVWSQFGANEVSSLAATFSLWIINLILPALVGTFFLLNVHTNKTFSHEKE